MIKQQIELIGYCGLYCADCIRYRSKAADLASALLNEMKGKELDKYAELKSGATKQFNAVKQFEHFRECCEVLEAIVNLQCNTPCRLGDGCSTFSCDILKCCRAKEFEGCWQCREFEMCGKFEPLESIHGDSPKENLRKIKKLGLDKWASSRCKPYKWQK